MTNGSRFTSKEKAKSCAENLESELAQGTKPLKPLLLNPRKRIKSQNLEAFREPERIS